MDTHVDSRTYTKKLRVNLYVYSCTIPDEGVTPRLLLTGLPGVPEDKKAHGSYRLDSPWPTRRHRRRESSTNKEGAGTCRTS